MHILCKHKSSLISEFYLGFYSIYGNKHIQQGVQKFSKIVINGSILNTKFAVERLDKKKHFQREKIIKNKCVKNFGWAVKKWSKRHFLFFGKNWTKSPETKKSARGKLVEVEEEKIEKSYKLKL